jgi:hypothetical protein
MLFIVNTFSQTLLGPIDRFAKMIYFEIYI